MPKSVLSRTISPKSTSTVSPKSTSMSLGSHFVDFIDDQIKTGRYSSASDVVRDGLRLLEERETKRRILYDALIEGEQSGPPQPFDNEAFLRRMRKKRAT